MSKSARNDGSGNYYFGYHSNPGSSYRPSSANRSRSTPYRTNTQPASTAPSNHGPNTGPVLQTFVDMSNKLNSNSAQPYSHSSNSQRPTSANAGMRNHMASNEHPTSAEILYQALHSNGKNTTTSSHLPGMNAPVGSSGPSAGYQYYADTQKQIYHSRPKSAGPTRRPMPSETNNQYYNTQQTLFHATSHGHHDQALYQDANAKIPQLSNKFNVNPNTGKPSTTVISVANSEGLGNPYVVNPQLPATGTKYLNVETPVNAYKPHYNYPQNLAASPAPATQTMPVLIPASTISTSASAPSFASATVIPNPTPVARTTLVSIQTSSPTHGDTNSGSFASSLAPLSAYSQIRPSSATSKIRQAISDSHKYTPTSNAANTFTFSPSHTSGAQNTSKSVGNVDINTKLVGKVDGDDGDNDIGTDLAVDKKLADHDDEDNDMDGKPVNFSRISHPEVSLTTPSHSLELGMNASNIAGMIDIRNASVDSLQDEDIDVGLSTLPNQFCTKRDATELKKLILMGNNDHGGIVPSSSALMDVYMVGKVIGVGSYGKVRVAWHRLTGAKVAIKTYDKSKMKDQSHWKRVYSEIKIMEQVSHPRISRLYEAVETPKRMHLIMECLEGGNLCSYVKQKKRLSEDESKRIFFQILQAVDYLHSFGITHRDIKLENVLFIGGSASAEIKLIDFGFSTVCQPGKRLKVFCGTPSYMAPEIVRRLEYEGRAVDMWSLGILLYALLCGCFPFRAKTYPDLYRRIARGQFSIPEELSSSVKDMLRNLLNVDPAERLTSHASLRHVWLQMQYSNASDLNKLRRETAILISDKPSDDIDEQVLQEMEKYGILREDIIKVVLNKTHTAIATLYYLLLDTVLTKRKQAGLSGIPNPHSIHNGNSKPIARSNSANLSNRSKAHSSLASGNGLQVNGHLKGPAVGNIPAFAGYNQSSQNMNTNIQPQLQQHIMISSQGNKVHTEGASHTTTQRPRSASAGRSSNVPKPLISFIGQR